MKYSNSNKISSGFRVFTLLTLLFTASLFTTYAEGPCDKGTSDWLATGTWEGRLAVGGASLRLVFNIGPSDKDGVLKATMDSPDQGAKGIPVDSVKLEGQRIVLSVGVIGGSYEGTLDASEGRIDGHWKQGGSSFPLILLAKPKEEGQAVGQDTSAPAAPDVPATLAQAESSQPDVVRPQTPVKPYPYTGREVTVKSFDGALLAGSLVVPEGKGPFPAALLVTGSGAQDRDETIYGHKPFLVIADYLARRGIASVRLDDRGYGKSQGNFIAATSLDFARDAEAALRFLKDSPEIDSKKVGIIGHSEGGIIAAMVASKDSSLAFAVLLAGPGVSGEELLYLQSAALLRAYGMGEDAVQNSRSINQMLYTIAKRNDAAEVLQAEIVAAYLSLLPSAAPEEAKAKAEKDALVSARQILSPWFRTFLVLDPRPYIRELRLPVLALVGSKDLQVPAKENLEALAKALDEGGNVSYTLVELPGLNHLFQTAGTGLPEEYGRIEETFSPLALRTMGDWLAMVLR